MILTSLPFQASAGTFDIFRGWGWNNINTGWLSVNSTNTDSPAEFGVDIDAGKNVYGYAWSSNLGWICFGRTCAGDPPGAPAAGWAMFDDSVTPARLTGWARIVSLASGQQGWISLNCSNMSSCAASNYYVYVYKTDGYFRGWAWNCLTAGGGSCSGSNYAGGLGWIRFDPMIPGQTQYISPYQGEQAGVPWLQVLYGDLYAKGNISTPSPFTPLFGEVNATYCLDKGGAGSTISQFTSGTCARSVNANLNLPKSSSNYTSTLGRIDLATIRSGRVGVYSTVSNLGSDIPQMLGGRIFETNTGGEWTMAARTVNNATGTQNGSGLIIVRGNLRITGNIDYQVSPISKLKQLASLGILVLDDGLGHPGNVYISPGVTNISANIYAEGTVSTGSVGNASDAALAINGVVVAHQFNFERRYPGGVGHPAEKVVYDGRITANTPPGMGDFTSSLPVISY